MRKSLYLHLPHLTRVSYESSTLKIVMEELQDNEFLLIVDWKMKIQMMLYRESMVQFFGKRGISLLGVAIVRKRTAEELGQSKKLSKFLVEFHDLISDNTTEDTFAAISAIEGLLKILIQPDAFRVTK